MPHAIPKIVYGPLNTTINLPYPPKGFGEPEQDEAKGHELVSLSGQRQVQLDYNEIARTLKFGALSSSLVSTLQSFYRTWAKFGKSFRYYDDGLSSTYTAVELAKLEFKPKRTGIVGTDFTYEVPFTFRRVEDEDFVDYLEADILNNQVAADDVDGLVLDHTAYKSVKIFYDVHRKTDTQEISENGYLTAIYKESTGAWAITPEGTFDTSDADGAGVSFSISGAQVQYTSTNLTGGNYTGTIRIKELTL